MHMDISKVHVFEPKQKDRGQKPIALIVGKVLSSQNLFPAFIQTTCRGVFRHRSYAIFQLDDGSKNQK